MGLVIKAKSRWLGMKPNKHRKKRYRLESASSEENRPEMFIKILNKDDECSWNPKVLGLEHLLSDCVVITWNRRNTTV